MKRVRLEDRRNRPPIFRPIDLGIIIPENDCVRLLSQFVEGLDLTDLYSTYSRLRENQARPRQMLKILLYALEGIYASRGIEKACQKNVDFMYLLEGKPAPDHTTIARFRSIHFAPCATHILALTTEFLKSIGEISCKEIFIDGTKIEANADRYTFVWKKAVTKNMAKRFDRDISGLKLPGSGQKKRLLPRQFICLVQQPLCLFVIAHQMMCAGRITDRFLF